MGQTSSLLNGWNSDKPLCPGCLEKNEYSTVYGFAEAENSDRIVSVKVHQPKKKEPDGKFLPEQWLPRHLPDKFRAESSLVYAGEQRPRRENKRWKGGDFVQFLDYNDDQDPVVEEEINLRGGRETNDYDWEPLLSGCVEGDVLLVQVDDDGQLLQSVDFFKVTKLWSAALESKVMEIKSGWIPKNCVQCCFEKCCCKLWNIEWKPFTDIVAKCIRDVTAVRPEQEDLLKLLKPDSAKMSDKAKRLHAFIKRDLASDGARLATSLTPTFLVANVPELQTAINNLMDTEQGGADLLAWTRVFAALAAVEKVSEDDERFICQLLNRKALKAIVRDVVDPFINMGKSSAGLGLMWRFHFDPDVGVGLERCDFGWKTAGSGLDLLQTYMGTFIPPQGSCMWTCFLTLSTFSTCKDPREFCKA